MGHNNKGGPASWTRRPGPRTRLKRSRAMADSTPRIPIPGHPGIYTKGNRYVVRFRHRGTLHSKSFRTLSEAKRFRGQVQSGDSAPTSREPFQTYAKRWLEVYTGRTTRGVSEHTRDS